MDNVLIKKLINGISLVPFEGDVNVTSSDISVKDCCCNYDVHVHAIMYICMCCDGVVLVVM